MSQCNKKIVTARDMQTNEHIFIECQDFKEAWNISGKLHTLELKEYRYSQVRLRSSRPSLKSYRWISLCKWIGA